MTNKRTFCTTTTITTTSTATTTTANTTTAATTNDNNNNKKCIRGSKIRMKWPLKDFDIKVKFFFSKSVSVMANVFLSHPDVFCKKVALKYLVKLTGKHVYRGLFQKKFQAVGLQLYLKRGSCKGFFL